MSIRLDTSGAPALVRFTFDGEWTAAFDLIELRRAAVRAGHLTPKSAVLFDLRRVTTLPNLDDLRVALLSGQKDDVWPARRAYLVAAADQYAIARQFQLFGPQSLVSEIFHNEMKALNWLAAISGQSYSSG